MITIPEAYKKQRDDWEKKQETKNLMMYDIKLTNMLKDIPSFHFVMVFRVLVFFFFAHATCIHAVSNVRDESFEQKQTLVQIGVVLDQNSTLGAMVDMCMQMALSDFYSAHPNYTTRLQLQTKNANSVLDANFAVMDLMKREEVQGIVGPQGSIEDTFFMELGERVHIPIISFTPKTSTLSENNYYVRTTPDDSVQAQALAATCQGFGWSQVVLLYEDSEYGNQFLSQLNKALREVESGLSYMTAIPTNADDSFILKELKNLEKQQTRVFIVHMNPSLGFRLFSLTKRAGVMSEGYAWIITDSLSNFLNSGDSFVHDSMHGVIGLKPYLPHSNNLKSFQERWKREMLLKGQTVELNTYGLWAYDAITALAIAVEKVGPVNYSLYYENRTENANLRISTFGPELLKELSKTKFRGLSGDFELVDGKLKLSAFEIFNVVGSGENPIGYWTPERGIVREISSTSKGAYSTSTKELKKVIWPGDSFTKPEGWAIPATGSLRIGVPWKHGFTEFAKLEVDPATNHTNATGFSIDIFLAALGQLPFPVNYEFHYYNDTENPDWSYDDMLDDIPQKFDIVIGDTTIWAPRANVVDFSQPYSESGVILVVQNKKSFDMWIFMKPLRWDLWLTIIIASLLMGIVLRILERRATSNTSQDSMMINKERSRGMIYWSPVTVLAFPERNMFTNNWSFFVLVFWLFMAFILMQSYTANLSAILTVDQLKFAFSDSYYVGFQEASFMKEFLTQQLHISESRLRSYSSVEQYHEAMSKGSKNGGIDAIFDEVPYMKILLNKYDSRYKMVGPTYRTGGFGFAFPLGSPLTAHFSKAILDVVQGANMTAIEQKNFGPGYSSQDPLSSRISQETASLTLYDFAGLFLIIGSVTIFALFCSETPIGRKLIEKTRQLIHTCFHFRNSRVSSSTDSGFNGTSAQDSGEEIQEPMGNNNTNIPVGDGLPVGDVGDIPVFVGDNSQHGEVETIETVGSRNDHSTLEDLGVPTHISEERNS